MSVLALPTYRQRPVSAPSMNYESSLMMSESTSQEDLQPLLDREALFAAWPKRSALVVEEIIVTEKNYVEALHDVVMGYLKPLYGFLLSVAEGPNFLEAVFCNIMKLQQINMELFNDFLQQHSNPREFGNIFVNSADHFMHYTEYCINFPRSEEMLQKTLKTDPETREFIMDCQMQVGHALPLITYLHKPVQRILKYRLLLEEVLKGFPEDLSGYLEIKCALETMSRVAIEINEKTRQVENRKRVENIQKSVRVKHKQWSRADLTSYGNLITEESCKVLGRRGGERQLLLFEKTVLFLSRKGADKFKYKDHIMVEELDLSEETNSPTVFKIFSHYSTSKHFTVQVRNTKVKEELISKFRSILVSHLEQENDSLQEEESEKETEFEASACSSMEDSTSIGDSDGSLSEPKMIARQRSRAFKSKDLQWRKRKEQTSTRKISERRSTLPTLTISEIGTHKDHSSKLTSTHSDETLSSGLLAKEDEDNVPKEERVIKLQRRSAVRYKRGNKGLGRAMTFDVQDRSAQMQRRHTSLEMLENDEVAAAHDAAHLQGASDVEAEAGLDDDTSIARVQSDLDQGIRSRAVTTSCLMHHPQVVDSPCDQSSQFTLATLSDPPAKPSLEQELGNQEPQLETSAASNLASKGSQNSWLCPVIEEPAAPVAFQNGQIVDNEDDEDEGEEEAEEELGEHDDHLTIQSSLRSDLRLKWTHERLEELRKGDVASFVTLPRKRKEDEFLKRTTQRNLAKQHSFSILDLADTTLPEDRQAKQTQTVTPAPAEEVISPDSSPESSLPVRGIVNSRISMFENLSKMCADNQATYDSIPQLRNRKMFSVKDGGHAMPGNLLRRKKRAFMGPTQALAREPGATNFTPPANLFDPSTSKGAPVSGSVKSAVQTHLLYDFDLPSLQPTAPDSMQYDSGVASDTNSPSGAPSPSPPSPSPLLQQHTLSSLTWSLTETVEQVKIPSLHETSNEKEITPLNEKETTPLNEKETTPLNEEETMPLNEIWNEKHSSDGFSEGNPQLGPFSCTSSALPDEKGTAINLVNGSAETDIPPTYSAAASGVQVERDLDTTKNPSELRERKPNSQLAPLQETSITHTHADSSLTSVQPLKSSVSASIKSQGAQIALNVAVGMTVVSLPSFYHTVMMGLIILAVCVFLFIMTLPYHTCGRNFLAN